jgi:hypothetical protein
LNEFLNLSKNYLEPIGARPENSFFKLLTENFKFQERELRIFKFFTIHSQQIIFHQADDIFDNFYTKDENLYKVLRHSLRKIHFYFLENKEPIHEEKVLKILLKEIKIHLPQQNTKEDLIDLLRILKNLSNNPFNFWGLKAHPFIEPRCLKDKIYLILENTKRIMHFREIYQKLNEFKTFNDLSPSWLKDYNLNSIRNELIKHQEFVLVKRGTYGLRKWGLIPGTAKELLHHILKERKKISKEKLWQILSSQKQIKKSSFYIYLKQSKNIKEIDGYLIYNG